MADSEEKTVVLEEQTEGGDLILRKGTESEGNIEGAKVVDTKAPDAKTEENDKSSKISTAVTVSKPRDIHRQIVDLNCRDVYVNPQAWTDLMLLVKGCTIEISGFGLVEEHEWGLEISKIFLLKQDGGGAHTTIDPMAMAELQMELHDQGIDTGKLRFWWHSHMGSTNPSGQDLETFAQFGRTGPLGPTWFIHAILNAKGEGYWRMDHYRPVRFAIPLEPTIIHPAFGTKDWATEIKNKVIPSQYRGTGYGRVVTPSQMKGAQGHSPRSGASYFGAGIDLDDKDLFPGMYPM